MSWRYGTSPGWRLRDRSGGSLPLKVPPSDNRYSGDARRKGRLGNTLWTFRSSPGWWFGNIPGGSLPLKVVPSEHWYSWNLGDGISNVEVDLARKDGTGKLLWTPPTSELGNRPGRSPSLRALEAESRTFGKAMQEPWHFSTSSNSHFLKRPSLSSLSSRKLRMTGDSCPWIS